MAILPIPVQFPILTIAGQQIPLVERVLYGVVGQAVLGRLVRPGKVAYSSGRESRSGKAGQPPDREFSAGGSNPKG
ncbi:hypothetical protein, partial [Thiolapillus sp.]|uniref:hypothetical protein n=1 Tax=Thiolapillus sp. TaxID=2017437 RepID=UPI003AF7B64A